LSEERCLKVGGHVLDRCPGFYRDQTFLSWAFRIHNWREHGIMPLAGGFYDQPNKAIEVCEFIDYLNAEKLRRSHKK